MLCYAFQSYRSRQAWAGEMILFLFLLCGPETRQRLAWCFSCMDWRYFHFVIFVLSWAFFRRLCFYVFLNACRSNRLSAGMGWRADYHYSYIRPATHRRLAWFFLMSDSPFVFVLGVRARPWWGLPQSVAVGVICPHLIFPELKCQ